MTSSASQSNEMIIVASDALLHLRAKGRRSHVVAPCKTLKSFETAPAIPVDAEVNEDTFIRGLIALYLGKKAPSRDAYREGGTSPLDMQVGYVKSFTSNREAQRSA